MAGGLCQQPQTSCAGRRLATAGHQTGTGDSDLQGTSLDFSDYTFLKEAEKHQPIKVSLWKKTQGSRVALLPNLNCSDAEWNKLLRDVRVRRALSLAFDRR